MDDTPVRLDKLHDFCMLHSIVRSLIVQAFFGDRRDKGIPIKEYLCVWIPDVKKGPSEIHARHNCKAGPESVQKRIVDPNRCRRIITFRGEEFWFAPHARQSAIVGTCDNCQCHFFAAVFDKDDLDDFPTFIRKLRKKKGKR